MPPLLICFHSKARLNPILRQINHKMSEVEYLLNLLSDAVALFRRYSLYLKKSLRFLFHYLQGLTAEHIDDFFCKCRTNPLYRSGRKILTNIYRCIGKLAFAVFSLELCSEFRMCNIISLKNKHFSAFNIAELSDSRNQITAGVKIKNCISVIFVSVKYAFHGSFQFQKFKIHFTSSNF